MAKTVARMGSEQNLGALVRTTEKPLYHWRRPRRLEVPATLVKVDGATLLGVRPVRLGRRPVGLIASLAFGAVGVVGAFREGGLGPPWLLYGPLAVYSAAVTTWLALRPRAARALAWIKLKRAPAIRALREQPAESWVRFSGRVLEGGGFRSASGIDGCVLAHYVGHAGHPLDPDAQSLIETHAIAFQILGPNREVFHVAIDHAHFIARPIPLDGRLHDHAALASRPITTRGNLPSSAVVRHEQVLRPGDEVEIMGQLHRDVDPTAAGGYRAPALRHVLRGTPRRKLQIRAV